MTKKIDTLKKDLILALDKLNATPSLPKLNSQLSITTLQSVKQKIRRRYNTELKSIELIHSLAKLRGKEQINNIPLDKWIKLKKRKLQKDFEPVNKKARTLYLRKLNNEKEARKKSAREKNRHFKS